VAALVPGILTYTTERGAVYLAVDEGVLVKTGTDVLVSVRHAIGGTNLGQLHDEIKRRFLTLDREERAVREMVAKMESAFVGRIGEFQHER
jgi:F-type H+-transporting ATPase subunit epsilon